MYIIDHPDVSFVYSSIDLLILRWSLHYAAKAELELTTELRLALNLKSSCLSLLRDHMPVLPTQALYTFSSCVGGMATSQKQPGSQHGCHH